MEGEITLRLTPEEAKELLDLLDHHLYFGWVALNGEELVFGEVSPVLMGLFQKVKESLEGGKA